MEGAEDRWIIKELDNKFHKLWHNNYVKTGPEDRYITEDFHDQKRENKSFSQLLTYIENNTGRTKDFKYITRFTA